MLIHLKLGSDGGLARVLPNELGGGASVGESLSKGNLLLLASAEGNGDTATASSRELGTEGAELARAVNDRLELVAGNGELLEERVVAVHQAAELTEVTVGDGGGGGGDDLVVLLGDLGELLGLGLPQLADITDNVGGGGSDAGSDDDEPEGLAELNLGEVGLTVLTAVLEETTEGGGGVVNTTGGTVVSSLAGESSEVDLLLGEVKVVHLGEGAGQGDDVRSGGSNAAGGDKAATKTDDEAVLGEVDLEVVEDELVSKLLLLGLLDNVAGDSGAVVINNPSGLALGQGELAGGVLGDSGNDGGGAIDDDMLAEEDDLTETLVVLGGLALDGVVHGHWLLTLNKPGKEKLEHSK